MAQGKLKVKSNSKKPSLSLKKKNPTKPSKVMKKGRRDISARKVVQVEMHKVKKNIGKGIQEKTEKELSARAFQLEDGKSFRVLPNHPPPKGKNNKAK